MISFGTFSTFFVLISALRSSLAATTSFPSRATSGVTTLPLIIWHGLGDDFGRQGLKDTALLAERVNPGTYVHVIRLADTPSGDRDATFLGNVTTQIEQVCKQLAAEPILSAAPAVNAL